MKACSLMHWPKPPREDDPSEQLEDAAGVEEQVFQSVAAMMTEYHQPLLVASRVGPSTNRGLCSDSLFWCRKQNKLYTSCQPAGVEPFCLYTVATYCAARGQTS
jgi:hypothetical protein